LAILTPTCATSNDARAQKSSAILLPRLAPLTRQFRPLVATDLPTLRPWHLDLWRNATDIDYNLPASKPSTIRQEGVSEYVVDAFEKPADHLTD